jgi:hypothetical protein
MTCSKPCTFRWTNLIMIRACNEHELLEHESPILQNGRKAFMHGIRRFVCNLMLVQIIFPRICPLTKVGFHLVE